MHIKSVVSAVVVGMVLSAISAMAGSAALASGPVRIIGGAPAVDVPYMVQVFDVRPAAGDVFQCGGTLVAKSWVLTARHCLADKGETTAVRVGSRELGVGTRVAVDRWETPPTAGDIALLHLSTALNAPVVRLATTEPRLPSTGTMYGWGAEAAEPEGQKPVMSALLKQATTNVWGDSNPDGDGGPGLSSWSLGDTGAAYKGDSGGPLVVRGIQVGVISTFVGTPSPNGFNDHANVAPHRAWIRSVTHI